MAAAAVWIFLPVRRREGMVQKGDTGETNERQRKREEKRREEKKTMKEKVTFIMYFNRR